MLPKPSRNRSKRLRKKLHVGEFQQFGFDVTAQIEKSVEYDAVLDAIINWVEDHHLLIGGGFNHGEFEAFICADGSNNPTLNHGEALKVLLTSLGFRHIAIGSLVDANYS